ncbi:hypothetical protein BH11BAC4_BH11BAC4_07170 [soil metagenome]
MNSVLKHIVSRTYKPLLVKYLSKTRIYRYKDIALQISPQVFHPGFFFSTQLLLQYIEKLPLKGKKFLELGCGSGLIATVAAKHGASVIATDINPVAVEFLKKNSRQNRVVIEILHSDLYKNIPLQHFDIIAINPPYYKKKPQTTKDHAWFCGENGEYFSGLFAELENYITSYSLILMVIFDGCNMDMINGFASQHGFILTCVHSRKNILEKNFIFKIEKK